MRRKHWLLSIFIMLLAACSGDSSISKEYVCYFIFNTQLHPLPCHLTGILGNPGHFVKVQTSVIQGVRHLQTTRNYDHATEDVILRNEIEKSKCELGANNCIIIGTSSYDNQLVAYDGQCPNCLKQKGGTNYPLTWQQNGTLLHCAKCDRSYDVNNGVCNSSGRTLLKYYAVLDANGLLRAWN